MFEKYTEKARRVIFFARYEASQYGSPYIETEHLLLGLLREDKALANRFLRTHGTIESTPTVSDGVVYVGSDDGKLYAFDAAGCGSPTCHALWTGRLGSPAFQSSPAVANGVVYIGSAHGLSAFAAAGCGAPLCSPLWKAVDNTEFFGGSPAVSGGRVYIGFATGLAVFSAAG